MPEIAELLRLEEYRALRATIRERGSVRIIVTALTFSAWAAAILAACALFTLPVFGLVPLVVLAAGFEVVFALHIGVERIGRYVQLHHEAPGGGVPAWEHTAMRFTAPAGGVSPLVPVLFIAAALLNFALGTIFLTDLDPAALTESPEQIFPYAALHTGFLVRVLLASRFAAGQRTRDLQEFERIGRSRDPNS